MQRTWSIVLGLSVGLIALAGTASAQGWTGSAGLRFEVSGDAGATWSQGLTINAGENALLRLVASYNTTVATAGFGKVGLGFIDFRDAGAGDTLNVASISDNIASVASRPRQVVDVAGGRRLQVTRAASGTGADPLAPSNRLAWGQLSNDLTQGFPVNPSFRAGPVTEVFRMSFGASPTSGFRTVRVEGQVATTQRGYTFISGGSPDGVDINVYPGTLTPGTSLSFHQLREGDMNPAIDPTVATITIIPAPSAAVVLALGGLVAARRRR